MTTKNFDTCTSFYLQNGAFIGRIVRLKSTLKTILDNHRYPIDVSSALAETTALTALMSAMLKFEGLFTLQIQGNGPVSLLVSEVTAEGKIRSTAKFDEEKLKNAKNLRKTQDIVEALPHLVGGGYMALTVDAQNGQPPYQGVVDLQGKNLTEFAARYFKYSEQIETILKLFIQKSGNSFIAGGIILQPTPKKGGKENQIAAETIAQTLEDANVFINSLKNEEMFDSNLSNEEILHRLFHAHNLEISGQKNYSFGCRCSREKLQQTLASFSKKQRADLYDQNGQIVATCHFCAQKYVFNKDEFEKTQKTLQ